MRLHHYMLYLCFCCLLILLACFPSSDAVAAQKTCTITYVFESSTSGVKLDADTIKRMKEDIGESLTVSSGTKVDIEQIMKTKTFQSGDIVWEYDDFDPKIPKIKTDLEVTIYWKVQEANQEASKCTISFEYKYDGGWRQCAMPDVVLAKIGTEYPCPADIETTKNATANLGETNKKFLNTKIEDTENDGIWKTDGFKNDSGFDSFVITGDVTVKATWKFEGKKHEVAYLAISEDESKPFPEALKTQVRPSISQVVEKGDWVRAYTPAVLQIEDGPGTWYFMGYTQSFLVGQTTNNCFIGKWKYLEKPMQVRYRFVSMTDNTELPGEIEQYLPLDANTYQDGELVEAIEPAEIRFQSKHDETYTSADKYWKFIGYDSTQKEMIDGQVEFVGKWQLADEGGSKTVVYTSADENEPIPDELYRRASMDFDFDALPDSGMPELSAEKKVFETADSKWTFDRFVHNKSSQNNAAEMYIGYWKFEEKSREISYSASSLTEGRALPASVQACLPEKQTVGARKTNLIPETPTEQAVRVTGASWVYKGYQELEILPGDTPVVFVSEWEYVPDEPVKAMISGKVTLSGKKLEGEDFEFSLVRNEEILETTANGEDGTFTFQSLQYSADDLARMPPGGFEYQVMEVDGGEIRNGTALDGTIRRITVLLGEKESRLTVQISGSPEFANTYSAEVLVSMQAKVEFSGFEFDGTVLRPVRMKAFQFELYEKDGGSWSLIGTLECDAQGTIHLQIPLSHLDSGLHCYQIVQKEQEGSHVLMDKRQHYFNLNVVDNGDGTLRIEPIYVGESVAAIQNVPVNLPELVFVNRVESETLSVEMDGPIQDRNGWQLFANGMPVETDETVLAQILTETESEVRFRCLPSYDMEGNRIIWSAQLATVMDVHILQADGQVKDSNYAENGDKIRSGMNTVRTDKSFSAELVLSGTDTLPEIRTELQKNGTECGHSLAIKKVDETKYLLTAENLGNGQYTAVVKPVPGYQVRYTGSNGKERENADDGGVIHLVKIPNTGDNDSVMPYLMVGAGAVLIGLLITRQRRKKH